MDRLRATDTGLLADALVEAGHTLPMPCRGRRSCGKCGVHVAGSVAPPDPEEAALLARSAQPSLPGYSYRLACMCRIRGEVAVIASSISDVVVAEAGMDLADYDGDAPDSLGVAIDIGTTTVTVLLFRLGDRERLADSSALNHQSVHGADVLSRIDSAGRSGAEPLQRLILDQLNAMLEEVLNRAGAAATDITRITITGNTTMLHLLCALPVASLGVFPFAPHSRFGITRPAAELLPALVNAELYLPPAISTYVGPDVTCGVLATGLGVAGRPELLVDLGTNGELALAAADRLWCCATAAGPAFEGAEISSGMPALPGAIDAVHADGDRIWFETIGNKRPKGVCGTGLIGAVDAWLAVGVVDDTGAMPAGVQPIGDGPITLTQADVRKLQLAKAAVAAGIDTLLHEAELTSDELATLHLAGGFGSYLQPGPAAGIGLFPEVLVNRVDPAGNSALTGAVLLTLSRAARQVAERRVATAVEVPLATHPVWVDAYIDHMMFGDDDA